MRSLQFVRSSHYTLLYHLLSIIGVGAALRSRRPS